MPPYTEQAPAFQFYARDWVARTREYGAIGRALLIDLMALCWNGGSIPVERSFLAEAVGMPEQQFEDAWKRIAHEFTTEGAPAGRLVHLELEGQRAFQAANREQRREAGKRSGATRRAKNGTDSEREANERSTGAATTEERNANTATATATASIERERESTQAHEQDGPTTDHVHDQGGMPARTCDRSSQGAAQRAIAQHARSLAPPMSLVNAVLSIGDRAAAANQAIAPDDYARRYVETYAMWRTKFTSQPAWSADAIERHAATVCRIVDGVDSMPEWNAGNRPQSQRATTSSGAPRGRAPVADFTSIPTGERL